MGGSCSEGAASGGDGSVAENSGEGEAGRGGGVCEADQAFGSVRTAADGESDDCGDRQHHDGGEGGREARRGAAEAVFSRHRGGAEPGPQAVDAAGAELFRSRTQAHGGELLFRSERGAAGAVPSGVEGGPEEGADAGRTGADGRGPAAARAALRPGAFPSLPGGDGPVPDAE